MGEDGTACTTWADVAQVHGLEGAADRLSAAAARALASGDPAGGRLALEAGIAEKMRGRIAPGFAGLQAALAALPAHDLPGRQRALFVLGLTWSDVGCTDEALRCLDAAAALDPGSEWACAARGYAEEYRSA